MEGGPRQRGARDARMIRILLAEDDDSMRLYLARALERVGSAAAAGGGGAGGGRRRAAARAWRRPAPAEAAGSRRPSLPRALERVGYEVVAVDRGTAAVPLIEADR